MHSSDTDSVMPCTCDGLLCPFVPVGLNGDIHVEGWPNGSNGHVEKMIIYDEG